MNHPLFMSNDTIVSGRTHMSKLAIFLFIIGGNYVGDIYSCSLRHLFNDSMIFKHFIGMFIMLFFVGLSDEDESIQIKIRNSVLLYIWFLFIMRSPNNYTLFIILIISILYLLNMYIIDLKKVTTNTAQIAQISMFSNYLFILAIITSIVGYIQFYMFVKNNVKNFSHYNFLIGSRDQECFSPKFIKKFNSSGKGTVPFKLKKRMH
jgi:hypothetical protein